MKIFGSALCRVRAASTYSSQVVGTSMPCLSKTFLL